MCIRSAFEATALKRSFHPLWVSTSVARLPIVCTRMTGSPIRTLPPNLSKCRSIAAIRRLVPPRAHHTPPSISKAWCIVWIALAFIGFAPISRHWNDIAWRSFSFSMKRDTVE